MRTTTNLYLYLYFFLKSSFISPENENTIIVLERLLFRLIVIILFNMCAGNVS